MNTSIRHFVALLIICFSCMSNSTSGISFINNSKPDPKSFNLIIHFKATVSGEPFVARKNYTNPFNESFSIEKFKFYFGKARLFDASSGAEISANPDEYFLIDFTDSVSCSIKLSIRPGKYSNIVFLLGVDSIHNVSGAQTGALDPAKGMFWTWNSGYIMAKLEGSSPLSNQPAHLMAYHIGGFREPNNAARNIDLSFPKEKKLEITDQKIHELYITADLNYWFNGPHPIHIKEIPDCTTPGILAKNISDNYTNMFSITQVIN